MQSMSKQDWKLHLTETECEVYVCGVLRLALQITSSVPKEDWKLQKTETECEVCLDRHCH